MDHASFSTLGEHPSERAACWGRICNNYFGGLDIDLPEEKPLDGQLTAFEVGALNMIRMDATSHRVYRPSTRPAFPTDDHYKLLLQMKGHGEFRQNGHFARLQPGDWNLYDPQIPYSFSNLGSTSLLVLLVPRNRLKGFRFPSTHAVTSGRHRLQGMPLMFASFLRSMAEQLPALPNAIGQSMSETVLGLLTSTMSIERDGADVQTPLPSVLMARVKQFIQSHLSESDLTIERIAREMRCSKRYLHRVFEDSDCSIERYIWQARLERCRILLACADERRRSISEIAYACGFNSSAHFCRLFKRQFGFSPSEFRQQSLTGASTRDILAH